MIYAPDGSRARHDTIPLWGRHAKWLTNGDDLLKHLAELEVVRIEPRCNTCGSKGHAQAASETDRVSIRCDCRAGRVKVDQPLVVEALLLTLGWGLVCTHCGERLTGNNDPQTTTWTVTCPCTTREYQVVM